VTIELSDSSAVQPTELPLRLAGVLLMNRSAFLIPNTIGEMKRPVNSLVGVPLIVNVMFLIVTVGRAVTDNIAISPSYTDERAPASGIAK